MKKFVIRIILFFVFIIIVDVAFGIVTKHLVENSKGGVTKQMHDLCLKDNYDILIMGSSRAHHHYVPSIIEDSVSLSTYNAGYDGNGIILQYGIYKMITQRYTPKVIIYDVFKPFDIYEYHEDSNNTRYIQNLKKYYYLGDVKEIVHSVNRKYKVQMLSNMYRFNGSMISIICDYLLKRPMDEMGYAPLFGEYKGQKTNNGNKDKDVIDPLKLEYLEKLIVETQKDGVKLIMVASPLYNNLNIEEYMPVINLCKKYNVAFIDYSNVETIVNDNRLWKESVHLNHNGATKFTSEYIAPYLKEVLSK